jgi:hypothetical protein
MHLKRSIALVALSAGLVAAAPAAAHGGGGDHGQRGHARADVPKRVATRVRRAERALDRASAYVEDGDNGSATKALTAVDRNLAKALKAAQRRISAEADNGPDAAAAVAQADDDVISEIAGLFDGPVDSSLESPLNDTLNGAIDGRDALVASIAALSDPSDYADVLDRIDSDVSDEIDGIDEALADDDLSDAAKADLQAARDKLTATQTTVQGLVDQVGASDSSSDASDDTSGDGDCPGHHGNGDSSSAAGARHGGRV